MKKDMEQGRGRDSTAFLLAQLGAHAAMKFAERLEPLGLTPPQAGMLRMIGVNAGLSQQSLGAMLSILPSRLVQMVDELETRGLVERRDSPDDRRIYALHLTTEGRQALDGIGRVARAHDDALCKGLDEDERGQLRTLLLRLAEQQGVSPGVHPGFRRGARPPGNDRRG